MIHYLIRRCLLMIPTFLGTTFLVFIILSCVPGGPFQRAVLQLKQQEMISGQGSISIMQTTGSQHLTPEILLDLKKQFGLDKPLLVRYLIWLGVWKRELKNKELRLGTSFREDLRYVALDNELYSIQRWVQVIASGGKLRVSESGVGSDFKFCDDYDELPDAEDIIDWELSYQWKVLKKEGEKVFLVKKAFSGILTLDFGTSYVYDEPVIKLIKDRIHISSYFGILGFLLSYMICIPLGIFKAVRYGSKFDLVTSVVIFIGYSIPGYILGAMLLVLLGGGSFLDVFPLGGFVSDHFSELSVLGKIKDLLHHTFLPVLSYTVGSFATLTILMKNSLIENLSQDYVRTAFAKGLSERRVIFVHALRNSLIPVATGIGYIIGIFLAGSYLIEKVFNINGIGMLSYKSILASDYPVIMGFLVINTMILLLGNIISDFIYALIDPRIRFK